MKQHTLYLDYPDGPGRRPKWIEWHLALWQSHPNDIEDMIPEYLATGPITDLVSMVPSHEPLFVRPYMINAEDWDRAKRGLPKVKE